MKTPDVNEVIRLAREAGERIMEVYAQARVAHASKADASPVTAADLAAHRVLARGLARLAPGAPVVSEEDLPGDAAEVVSSGVSCWLVDPLDGTRDFLARTDEFTVNVAWMMGAEPVVGVVLTPVSGRVFVAVRGLGAFEVTGSGRVPLATRAMHSSRFVALVSNMHNLGEAARITGAFADSRVRPMGSSLKYVTIAEGAADVAVRYGPTSLWDTAAAQCILEEAGGALVDFNGKTLTYSHGVLLNPPFVAVGDRSVDVPGLLAALGP